MPEIALVTKIVEWFALGASRQTIGAEVDRVQPSFPRMAALSPSLPDTPQLMWQKTLRCL
jgi:hypothetical protein